MNRRGILAALLCTPALLHSRQTPRTTTTLELDDDFVLEVRYGKDTITLRAKEIWAELRPTKPSNLLSWTSKDQGRGVSEQ
jgi:hypothetical protein